MREEKRWCGDNASARLLLWSETAREKRKMMEKAAKKLVRIQPNRSSEKKKRKGGGGRDGEKDRLYIQLLLSFHHQLSSLSPPFHPALPLSPIWVMSGSNWWILLTFPALHFHVSASVCVCARHRFPLRLRTLQYFLSFDPAPQSALNNVLPCHVTNWADPVREEDIGNNGV